MSDPTKTITNGASNSTAGKTIYDWAKKTCPDVLGRNPTGKAFDLDNDEHVAARGLVRDGEPGRFAAVFINKDNLWDNAPQILHYWFLGGSDVQKQKVIDAVDEWSWYANVQFVAAPAADKSEIRITFDPNDGSWSYIGMQSTKISSASATMNLAWLDPESTPMTLNERSVVLHEFGHVLGLMHEHQSPAHGGVAIKNIQAAIDFYHNTQGWSIQEVYDQVINVQKMADVSNFSQVDTNSIMHYPQPKELTGLSYDIPYNDKLDDLDKAYMILQYPRKTMHPKAAADGWSFEKALRVIGAPADVTAQILRFIRSDRDRESGEIDPQNIRAKIAEWSRGAHSQANAPAGTGSSPNPSFGVLPKLPSYGRITISAADGKSLCGVDSSTSKGDQPAHAVMSEDELWILPEDEVFVPLTIKYGIRCCDRKSRKIQKVEAYQVGLVRQATAMWASYADVTFIPAKSGDPVDLLIQFSNDSSPNPLDQSLRSTTVMQSGTEKMKRRSNKNYQTTEADLISDPKPSDTPWLKLDPDIEFFGIFADSKAASGWSMEKYKTETGASLDGYGINQRTVIHELGHWLGLRHELSGLYGYWMHKLFDEPEVDELTAKSYWATRYDDGSVMDGIGYQVGDAMLDLFMSVNKKVTPNTVIDDKTPDQSFSKINITLVPTPVDNANIALLYPGGNLVVQAGSSGGYVLKPSETRGFTLLEHYLDVLHINTQANVQKLSRLLLAGRWREFRTQYLAMLKTKQEEEAKTESEKAWKESIWKAADVTISDPDSKGHSAVTKREKFHGTMPTLARDANNPAPSAEAPPFVDGGPFITQLYDKLSSLYNPGGGQYFALQFPTRFLDKETYAYKLDGYFSRFEKPVVVNEAEFSLTDALYEVAPIVGGPNGQSLSKNYSKALNSLIPTFENVEVRKQRELMRAWLMAETKSVNSAFTTDTRLSFPGITEAQAQDLSLKNGLTITVGPATGDQDDSQLAVIMAQDAIDAIKRSGRADPRGMTRMEYSDSLMQAYLNDRKTWELQRDDMIKAATEQAVNDPSSMEKVTRTLAHITAIEEAKLASKYADAVVRGYSHTVRGFMGHLDIKSTAEFLQDAKDSFRESALSSLYAASSVYPVAMLPTDWFQALDTNFTREDLSQDKDLIKAAVMAKSQLIDNLETQIGNLRAFNRGDPATAKKAMDDAAAARETAMANLSKAYTASAISAVKIAIQVAAAAAPGGAEIMAAEDAASAGIKAMSPEAKGDLLSKYGLDENTLTDIGNQMDAVQAANSAVNAASRNLTEHMSEYASAVAGDTGTMIETLQMQLTTAKAELLDLQQSYTIAARASNTDTTVTPTPNADGTTPAADSVAALGKLPQGGGGSRWSEVHIQSSTTMDFTSSQSTSESSVSTFNCNFWIGSYSQSNSSASASNSANSASQKMDLEISMRTTYVTVDRSGWFDPSLFEMSKSFMQGVNQEDYVTWCQYPGTTEDAAKQVRENGQGKPKGYFGAFPVGYVLVKDCVIKILDSSASSASYKKHFDESSEKSGGFLCFSASSASRSSNDTSGSTTKSASDGLIVRIPGPQILGYVMQIIHKDETQVFKPMPADQLFIEDTDNADANSDANQNQPSRDIGPNLETGSRQPPKRVATIRDYDDDKAKKKADVEFSTQPISTGPARDIGVPLGAKPGNLVDALETALAADDAKKWLASQPDNAKDELWKKLMEAFGKA